MKRYALRTDGTLRANASSSSIRVQECQVFRVTCAPPQCGQVQSSGGGVVATIVHVGQPIPSLAHDDRIVSKDMARTLEAEPGARTSSQ